MRTLKKTLALVLVVAMMMSLCITSNAAFTDADEIEYVEAVEVMTAIGVIEGFPAGDFQPQGSLTRAQAAKILVYLLGAENEALADGQIFDDVKENHWAADYIAYCAENGLVNGYGDGNFGPEDKLTGYQWAKMLLAALGVDTTEMIGAAWQIPVATAAAKYNIFAENEMADKTEICSREEACLYALNAAKVGVKAGYAVYDGDGDVYNYYNTVTEAALAAIAMGPEYEISKKAVVYADASILRTIHGVIYDSYADAWGRPGVCYYDARTGGSMLFLVYLEDYLAKYEVATTECDIASDIGLRRDTWFNLYTNGDVSDYQVQLTDTVQTIGAQGTLVEVYEDEIVVIDTFLAMVVDVTDITYDKAGHQKSPATITLAVFNNSVNKGEYQLVTDVNYYANYEYNYGDMVLVNAYTENDVNLTTGDVTVGIVAETDGVADYIDILGIAKTMVGAQTFLWYNAERHTIDKVDYYDAKWFELDQAEYSTADHTWYFDQYGNLIGATDIATVYAYGIIKDIQWINPVGASGYAQATIVYMDGSEEVKAIASIDGTDLAYASVNANNGGVYTDIARNDAMCGNHLYRIETGRSGLILTHVATYDKDGKWVSDNEIDPATVKTGVSKIAEGVYANNNTVYLVQTFVAGKAVYTPVTGYENIDSYTQKGDCVVDYVDIDADPYVDYVYITGTSDSSSNWSLFFQTEASVKVIPGMKNTVKAYELTGILDGVAGQTITVSPEAYEVLKGATMSVIGITDGVVVKAYDRDGYADELISMGGKYAANNLYMDYKAMGTTASYDGEVLMMNGEAYNVVGLETTYGDWAYNLTNKAVYVVYNSKTLVAESVYIISAGDIEEDSGIGEDDPGAAVVYYQVKVVNKYGVVENWFTVGAQVSDAAIVDSEVSYADVIAGIEAGTVHGFASNIEVMESIGIYNGSASSTSVSVNVKPGNAQYVTFVVNADDVNLPK